MTYYDCCEDGCCLYIKWPNMIFLLLVIFALLLGCGCCCFFLVTDAQERYAAEPDGRAPQRSRRWAKSQRRKEDRQQAVYSTDSTAPRSPAPPDRYWDHRRSTVV